MYYRGNFTPPIITMEDIMSDRRDDYPDFIDEIYVPRKNEICVECQRPAITSTLDNCHRLDCPYHKDYYTD